MLRVAVLVAILACLSAEVQAMPHNPNTDWFSHAGWGIFVHFLYDVQCVGDRVNSMDGVPDWNQCVNGFDTEKFAREVKETGAHYVIFTMMQRTRYLIAPNATYDRLTGYKPGQACSRRDLVEDLYRSLHKRGIPLMLYWTGDGPRQDPQAAKGMGCSAKVTREFVQKWADVVAEYGERYKDKVVGWWTDGCYSFIGYDEEKWSILAKGLRAGNPKRIIAMNNPQMTRSNSSTPNDDFTTGEQNSFTEIPESRWRDGVQWHVLSYLGDDWASPGQRYNWDQMANYVHLCNRVGGVVSIDVLLYRDGSIEKSHLITLKAMNRRLLNWKDRKPVPEGNLACWKPARILSLDGKRDLPPNGGGGGLHRAEYGVDGQLNTFAEGSQEWPWTYEVDLTSAMSISRLVLTFGPTGFATDFDILVSTDRQTWQRVGGAQDYGGGPFTLKFGPVDARYVRIAARKPDGPDQRGSQMQVAELELYH